jgi:hypothetical protein
MNRAASNRTPGLFRLRNKRLRLSVPSRRIASPIGRGAAPKRSPLIVLVLINPRYLATIDLPQYLVEIWPFAGESGEGVLT